MDCSDMRSSPVADVGPAHGTSLHGRAEGSPVEAQRVLHACSRALPRPARRVAHRSRLTNHPHRSMGPSAENIELKSFTRVCPREPSRSWRSQ